MECITEYLREAAFILKDIMFGLCTSKNCGQDGNLNIGLKFQIKWISVNLKLSYGYWYVSGSNEKVLGIY